MRHPERENTIQETYDELIAECEARIDGINNQILLTHDKRNTIIKTNRAARVALDIFDAIINKKAFTKGDLEMIVERIYIYEDRIVIKLKSDITQILESGTLLRVEEAANFKQGIIDSLSTVIVQTNYHRPDKVYDVHVISDGDPLEIYTEKDGGVIFRKYSPMGDLQEFASQMCESIASATGHIAAVADRDSIIALHGVPKRELVDKPNSPELEKLMELRKNYRFQPGDPPIRASDGSDKYHLGVAAPILSQGDLMGCVLLLLGDEDAPLQQADQDLAKTVAGFLGKQMES